MAALESWINRLRSISVIVEQGCRSNGNSGAGELLLDMVGDVVQEICSSRSPPEEQEDGGRRPVEVGMEEEEEETTPTCQHQDKLSSTTATLEVGLA